MQRTKKTSSTATSQTPQTSNAAASDELLPLDNEEKEFMEQISKSLQQTTDAFMKKQKQELAALLTDWKTQSLAYLVEERRKMTKRPKKAKKQENAESPSEQNPQTTQTEQQPAKSQPRKKQTKQKEETQQQPEGSASTSSPQGSPSMKRQPAEKKEKEPAKKSPATPKTAPTSESETSEATATTTQSKKKEKKEKPKYIHNTASVELRIPAAQADLIQEWSNKVVTEDKLFIDPYDPTFGRETDSHVTVCMNLPDEAYTEIEGIANATSPLTLKFLEATVYPGNGYDSIVLPVQPTNELFHLREEVSKHCIRAGAARRPPHCVIAYVKRGAGHKLLKEQPFKLEDSPLCNEIVFVERTGNKRVFQTKK